MPTAGGHDHAVTFYASDQELADQVYEHLRGSAEPGTAIVIATQEHRRLISERLARGGIDVPAEWARGSYVALDAREVMASFMVAGWPDAAAFWAALSPVLKSALARPGPVRVFGEMVALLWADGRPAPLWTLRRSGTSWPASTRSRCSAPTPPASTATTSSPTRWRTCTPHTSRYDRPGRIRGLTRTPSPIAVTEPGQLDQAAQPGPQAGPRMRPLVGTPVPAVTSTGPSPGTWFTELPRTCLTASAMPFMPCR